MPGRCLYQSDTSLRHALADLDGSRNGIFAALRSARSHRKQSRARTMSWLQISGGSLGLSQTLRLISFLITHACLMSGTLTLLSVCLPAWLPGWLAVREISKKRLFVGRLVLIWRLECLCDNVARFFFPFFSDRGCDRRVCVCECETKGERSGRGYYVSQTHSGIRSD